jgi:hypothetical protein
MHESLAHCRLRKKIELDVAVSEHQLSRHAAAPDELVVDLEDGAGLEVADHHHVAALLEDLPKLFLALLDLQIVAAHVSEVLRNLAPTLYLDIDVALRQPDCRCQPEPMHRGIEIDDSVDSREDAKTNYPDRIDRSLATPVPRRQRPGSDYDDTDGNEQRLNLQRCRGYRRGSYQQRQAYKDTDFAPVAGNCGGEGREKKRDANHDVGCDQAESRVEPRRGGVKVLGGVT